MVTSRSMRWLALLALVSCTAGPPDGVAVGQLAPALIATDLSGGHLDTRESLGHPVVLVFWASWSGSCRRLAPDLRAAQATYGDRVTWIGINAGEDPGTAAASAARLGIDRSVLSDQGGVLRKRYAADGVPFVVILDSDGVVRYRGHGLPSGEPSLLDSLLG